MPFISAEILKGRTREQKERFVERVTAAAVDELGAAPENVRIRLVELDRSEVARGGDFLDALDAERPSSRVGSEPQP